MCTYLQKQHRMHLKTDNKYTENTFGLNWKHHIVINRVLLNKMFVSFVCGKCHSIWLNLIIKSWCVVRSLISMKSTAMEKYSNKFGLVDPNSLLIRKLVLKWGWKIMFRLMSWKFKSPGWKRRLYKAEREYHSVYCTNI